MCANNYLGLGDNQRLIDAAKKNTTMREATALLPSASSAAHRISTNSSRRRSPSFLGTDDTILYSSCFDANGGLFETILTADDAVISDELNHASIIDGIRLCKAKTIQL